MNRIVRALSLSATFAIAAGGCLAEGGKTRRGPADGDGTPIQGGDPDAADPAVGLVWFEGGGFCTGTLIAPNVVLTAGHCVQDPIAGFYTGAGIASTNLSTPPSNMVAHAAESWVAHPSYQAGTCPNTTFDLGMIKLAAPIDDIAPVPFAAAAAGAPAAGTSCQAIGYGAHDENGQTTYAAKRHGTETVEGAASTYVTVTFGNAVADHGDSGGPLVCNGVIAGATSCHTDGDFPSHQTEYYARVDTAADWIAGNVAAWSGGTTTSSSSSSGGGTGGGGAGGGGGGGGGTTGCDHALCDQGGELARGCDPCVTVICGADPYCCDTSWDSTCVNEVGSFCGTACGGSGTGTSSGSGGGGGACAHAICATGGTLQGSCDPCAQEICDADAYCCSTAWDGLCVEEVGTVCGQTCGG